MKSFIVPKTQSHPILSEKNRTVIFARLSNLLQAQDAVLIAHYYTDPDIQALAEHTKGFIGDSLSMARFGYESKASTLMVAGVRFMGESASILSPEKRVLMPTSDATCSLDLGCPIDEFSDFCDHHPDRTVVVYANTSAAVKARADWVVTSSNALDIVDYLDAKGKKILWAPDRYLGHYIQRQTKADMVMWQGSCVVHEEFKYRALESLKRDYPNAAILVHPESPPQIIALADVVGSTSQLLQASQVLKNKTFIVGTDRGIFYKMQQYSPKKEFIEVPTTGHGETCRSCGHCPWMAMNSLANLEQSLLMGRNQITLDSAIIEKAKVSLTRMLAFNNKK